MWPWWRREYGTAGGWPRREYEHLTGAVLLLNAAVASSGRPVQFAHLPTVAAHDATYFDPLANLDIGTTRMYVGLIHPLHKPGGLRRQLEWVARHRPEFGIAAPCGFGRGPGKMSR